MKQVVLVLFAILAAAFLAAVLTVGMWRGPLEKTLWPQKLDERGYPAYELVAETSLHPYPEAVSVRLFVENDQPEGDPQYGVFVEPEGRVLTSAQRTEFEGSLSKASTRNRAVAACFIPHHFLRYYDASGKQVGEIAVCFCCSGAVAIPELFKHEGGGFLHPYDNHLAYDRARLKALIESLGLPSDVWCRESATPQ